VKLAPATGSTGELAIRSKPVGIQGAVRRERVGERSGGGGADRRT
jgi:hypothetical protein